MNTIRTQTRDKVISKEVEKIDDFIIEVSML